MSTKAANLGRVGTIAGYGIEDVTIVSLAALSFSGNAGKVIAVNAGETGFELTAAGGSGGDLDRVLSGSSTVSANKTRLVAGPYQVNDGGVVTVEDGAVLGVI